MVETPWTAQDDAPRVPAPTTLPDRVGTGRAADHLTCTTTAIKLGAVRAQVFALCAAFGLACGGLGYAMATGTNESTATECEAGMKRPAPKSPAMRGLLCTNTRAPTVGEEGCEAQELRARWCESELAEARRERSAVRNEWPDDDSIESPERWANAVEEAIEHCDMGAQLELVDCTEYPCTAALRPATPPPTPEAFEVEMRRVMAAARGCAPLRDAFGLNEETTPMAIDAYRLDARCDGAREDFLVLTALDPAGDAFSMIHRDRTDQEDRDFNRWLYRRADDMSALWPCL